MLDKKVGVLALILTFCLAYLTTIGASNAWTNVTCINGDAFKVLNLSVLDEPINETQICGNMTCIDGLGCINPRSTAGEVYMAIIFVFIFAAGLFAYLALQTTNKEYAPMRLMFFFLSFIMIMAGVFQSYAVLTALGHLTLSTPFLGTFGVFSAILVFLIWYQVIPFIKWVVKKLTKPEIEEEVTDVI